MALEAVKQRVSTAQMTVPQLQGALRNPAAADGQQGRLFIGFAAAELLGLIAFAVAMIILYAV